MIQTRYVEPVLTDMQLASIVFSPEIDWQNQVLACMHRIYDLSLSQPSAFEMEIQELLLSIWIEIYRHASFPVNPRTRRQRVMLSGSAFCSTTSTAIIWSI